MHLKIGVLLSTLDITCGALTYQGRRPPADLTVSSTGHPGDGDVHRHRPVDYPHRGRHDGGLVGQWHENGDRTDKFGFVHGDHDERFGGPKPEAQLHHR